MNIIKNERIKNVLMAVFINNSLKQLPFMTFHDLLESYCQQSWKFVALSENKQRKYYD